MLVGTRRPHDWDEAKMATLLKLRNLCCGGLSYWLGTKGCRIDKRAKMATLLEPRGFELSLRNLYMDYKSSLYLQCSCKMTLNTHSKRV